eukprot:8518163-Pyramimonas_sp.AAC.1
MFTARDGTDTLTEAIDDSAGSARARERWEKSQQAKARHASQSVALEAWHLLGKAAPSFQWIAAMIAYITLIMHSLATHQAMRPLSRGMARLGG